MHKYKINLKVISQLVLNIETENINEYLENMDIYDIDDFTQCDPYDFEVIDYKEIK